MKKMLILTSIVALAAGCSSPSSSTDDRRTAYNTESGSYYPAIPPNQKGAGAAALTGNGGINEPGYGTTQPYPPTTAPTQPYPPMGAPAPYEQGTATVSSGQLSAADLRFIDEAYRHGQAEVRMGQLLVQNSPNQAVKDYGQKLVTDHTRINLQLAQLASAKGATLPTTVDSHRQHELEHLSTLSGQDFDKSALKDTVRDHERDIHAFQNAANTSQDPDVKAFAQQTIPVLQDHLTLAKQLDQSVKSGGTT